MVVRPKYCRFALHNGFIYFLTSIYILLQPTISQFSNHRVDQKSWYEKIIDHQYLVIRKQQCEGKASGIVDSQSYQEYFSFVSLRSKSPAELLFMNARLYFSQNRPTLGILLYIPRKLNYQKNNQVDHSFHFIILEVPTLFCVVISKVCL